MIEINKLNARIYSKLGQSGALFGVGLIDVLDTSPDVLVLSADMSTTAGLDRFKTLTPNSFYNVGIAEQNLLGIAAGLSSEEKQVIITAQAAFISMRSCEQVRQYMGYMHSNIIAVGIGAGFALTFFGNTHYAIEDISIMRSIPSLIILSPSDAGQAAKSIVAAMKLNAPVYIRLTGTMNCPIVYSEDFDYQIGRSILVKEGSDITIVATGSMVYNSIKAAEILEEKGVSVRVVDMHTIKPLDVDVLKDSIGSKLFVAVEEHNIVGGLGTAISEYLASQSGYPSLLCLGIKDRFSQPGDYNYLLEQNGLLPTQIAQDIEQRYFSLQL